ncbi:MAG: hypothetical protein IPM30_05980 [Burkholderiales bacterium]|jgi:cell division transport system permease protein|nr:hypothetical protein [Burkholderiales bacterium]
MKALAVRLHGLREAARLVRRRPGSFLLAVLLAAATFTLPLAGVSIARSAAPLLQQLPPGPEINLFLVGSTSTTEIRQLQSQLAARPDVTGVDWITRDAALKALIERAGGDGLSDLKANPLPDVIVVTLSPKVEPAELQAALAELRRLPRVESVAADTGWHQQLRVLLRTAAAVGAVVTGLATGLVILIVLASVQLQLTSSAADLRLFRLVGADRWFIVRPYAYAGALVLFLGVVAASGLAWIGLAAAARPLSDLALAYGATLELRPLPLGWLAAAAGSAAVIGAVVAALGTRWELRRLR